MSFIYYKKISSFFMIIRLKAHKEGECMKLKEGEEEGNKRKLRNK